MSGIAAALAGVLFDHHRSFGFVPWPARAGVELSGSMGGAQVQRLMCHPPPIQRSHRRVGPSSCEVRGATKTPTIAVPPKKAVTSREHRVLKL